MAGWLTDWLAEQVASSSNGWLTGWLAGIQQTDFRIDRLLHRRILTKILQPYDPRTLLLLR